MHAHLGLVLALLVTATWACSDSQHHLSAPARTGSSRSSGGGGGVVRPLPWGQVQVLSTTDIHGWYQGHLKKTWPEPNYSGDWGDFASFVTHMRALARRRGVDLLVVDSGDLHDGAGLSDGYIKGQGPDAHVSNQFHAMVAFDVLTVGNHELYVYENALDTFRNFVPLHRGRYLASNVNITHTKGGRSITEPMGRRYAKFTTERGRKVTSLGILFDFKGQDNGLTVQAPTDMVKEAWFLDAIHDRPDFFLLVGHMPVRNDDWPVVIEAIRAVHADVPLVIAGGHTHIRDCVVYDDNAFGIESGRYLETVGWLAFNESDGGGPTAFGRSYIDANRRNYAFHAGLSGPSQLPTSKGRRITRQMDSVAQAWNLTEVYGSTPTDYYLSRVPPSSPSSILHLLAHEVLPTVISTSNANRTGVPNIVLANSGSQRFDIYKGPFTKNDQYIVSPFKDHFLFLRDVPYRHASQIVQRLNTQGPASARATPQDEDMRVNAVYAQWTKQSAAGARVETSAGEEVSLGYVTKDSCPGRGDDTEHSPIPYADQPDFVASPPSNNVTALGPDDAIDVIFLEFALPDILRVLNAETDSRHYTPQDAVPYNQVNSQDLYQLYALQAWSGGE